MSWDWGNAAQGAVGGGATGALSGGPGGGLLGGALGFITGGMTQDPKTADEMGIKPLDLKAEARNLMPTEGELESKRESFNGSLNGQIKQYQDQLIATGIDPARATKLAQNRFMAQRNRYMSSEQSSLANMERGLMSQMLPAKMARDEAILNIDNAADAAPSVIQSMAPMIAGAGMMRGMGPGDGDTRGVFAQMLDFGSSVGEHGLWPTLRAHAG